MYHTKGTDEPEHLGLAIISPIAEDTLIDKLILTVIFGSLIIVRLL